VPVPAGATSGAPGTTASADGSGSSAGRVGFGRRPQVLHLDCRLRPGGPGSEAGSPVSAGAPGGATEGPPTSVGALIVAREGSQLRLHPSRLCAVRIGWLRPSVRKGTNPGAPAPRFHPTGNLALGQGSAVGSALLQGGNRRVRPAAFGPGSRRLGGTPCRWRARSDSAAAPVVRRSPSIPLLGPVRRFPSGGLPLISSRSGPPRWAARRQRAPASRSRASRRADTRRTVRPGSSDPVDHLPGGHPLARCALRGLPGGPARALGPELRCRRTWLPPEPVGRCGRTPSPRVRWPTAALRKPSGAPLRSTRTFCTAGFGWWSGPGTDPRNGTPGFRAGASHPSREVRPACLRHAGTCTGPSGPVHG
jgi:hypothetical protein